MLMFEFSTGCFVNAFILKENKFPVHFMCTVVRKDARVSPLLSASFEKNPTCHVLFCYIVASNSYFIFKKTYAQWLTNMFISRGAVILNQNFPSKTACVPEAVDYGAGKHWAGSVQFFRNSVWVQTFKRKGCSYNENTRALSHSRLSLVTFYWLFEVSRDNWRPITRQEREVKSNRLSS